MINSIIKSFEPLLVIIEEMTQHVESSFGLIGWHHMACVVDQHKPKIVVDFCPSSVFSMDGPNLFSSSFPEGNANPIESIDIVKYSWSIDNEVILSVVD